MGAARKLMVCDLFCGAGGTSTGVALACRELDRAVELLAINHWERAIETHRKNHPWARHLCANVEMVDPRKMVPDGYLDLLVASPECIFHSTARGGKPINDQSRASAWRVLEWCERLHVSNVIIENVPEFTGWAPLGADDRPLKSRKGQIFRAFIGTLEAMNYRVDYRILNAADYGAATSRKRLFILAKKGRRRIPWPEPTHAKDSRDLFGKLKPWRAAREIIDWSIPGKSIFTRKKPLARTTLLRIEAGLKRYGGPLAPLFVSALRAYMDGRTCGEPVELTLTDGAAEAFMAVLRGTKDRQVNASARSCGEPVPVVTAGGGHIGLVEPEAFVLQQQSGGAPRPVREPLPTIAGKGAQAIIDPKAFMIPFYTERSGQNGRTHSIDDPLPTVPCSPKFAMIESFVVTPGGPDLPNGRPVSEPLPTVTCGDRMALVNPIVVQTDQLGSSGKCVRSAEEPVPTLHTKNNLILVDPVVVGAVVPDSASAPGNTDETARPGRKVVVQPFILAPLGIGRGNAPRSTEQPMPTILASRGGGHLVTPVVVQVNHGEGDETRRSHSVDRPLPTICASPGMGLAQPCIVEVNHGGPESGRSQPIDEPLKALTTKNGKAIVDPTIVKYYSNGDGKYGQSIDEPLDTVTTKQRFALAEPVMTRIGIDIRFRMFRTHELARAMGFSNYQFVGTIEEQTRQIGNAVEVTIAKALAKAMLEN